MSTIAPFLYHHRDVEPVSALPQPVVAACALLCLLWPPIPRRPDYRTDAFEVQITTATSEPLVPGVTAVLLWARYALIVEIPPARRLPWGEITHAATK
jgi:hypothetical protein